MEVTSVLVEGGRELLEAMFTAGLVDRVALFIAPKVIAGKSRIAAAHRVVGRWRAIGSSEMFFEGSLR
jgi:diaminohydroxyphosphoribosylaminopyrimidine deaminase/5-amino-6-(5-phosphoribosylamino)uracil reductase